MPVPLNIDMAAAGNILPYDCDRVFLRESDLKSHGIEKQPQKRIQSNQSDEQLVSGRIPVDHPGPSIIHMTDRIKEGFVVSLKLSWLVV